MHASCIIAPEILLPAANIDLYKWAVIACDQHTSDPQYWKTVESIVSEQPSTLRLTLPEIYLSESEELIQKIAAAMKDYRKANVFRKLPKGFVLVERKTKISPIRYGIVLAVDLEQYSYEKHSDAAIRATEATILERIPPRLKIRKAAEIEFPHILLLYDDPEDIVLGDLKKNADLPLLYDTELNMGGGHIRGKFISDTKKVIDSFSKVEKEGLLFMVGDGNHSLATAKEAWNQIRKTLTEKERETHPARYALCEAVNLYDSGITFEAIHRVVKGVDPKKFLQGFLPFGTGEGAVYVGGEKRPFGVADDVPAAVAGVDTYISKYIAEFGGEVDYIHGEEELRSLTEQNSDCVGVYLPKMNKADLFVLAKQYGSLPRKTFSMGESEEKRYYIEGREIKK